MEFGVVGFDGFAPLSSDHAAKQKWCGSAGFLKQERHVTSDDNAHDCRASKVAKLSNELSPSRNLPSKDSSFVFSDAQQEHNMLSFSSPKLENKNLLQSSAFGYHQHPSSSYYKNAGYSCSGGLNASMYFPNGVKGPFTTSQWLELEQQALIYKYIIANEPIPPNLLTPIKRALESAGFCSFPGGLLRPNAYGWGPFHLGFSNSTDPEPGRCRRTDGKKWRCSREAVPDQKYCERHINRGRHRSRKPVEGQSVSGAPTNRISSTTDLMNMSASASAAPVVPGGSASNSFAFTRDQSKDLHSVASNHLPSPMINRQTQDATELTFLSPSVSLNSSVNTFSIAKESAPYAEVASSGFAFSTADALLNSTQRSSSVYRTYGSSHDLNAPKSDTLHPFMDDRSGNLWTKVQSQSDRTQSGNLWTKVQPQSDRTQLSISIPVTPADFMSSTSSPTGEKVSLSPLRLSREIDLVQMGLGVGMAPNDRNHYKQADSVPISWEASMGGPLGEVLKSRSNSSGDYSKNVSGLNLLTKGWENSPQLTSSPTGVLQRTPMVSLSSSSAGSSPRAEAEIGKALKSSSLCGDLIDSSLRSSSVMPTL